MLWAEMQSGAKCLLEFLKAGQELAYAKHLAGLRELQESVLQAVTKSN